MAQIVCIAARTYNPVVNKIGDVVSFYKDEHVFDPNELDMFDIIDMPGTTVTQVGELMPQNNSNKPITQPEKKYKYNASGLSVSDRQKLGDSKISPSERLVVLNQVITKSKK